MVIAVVKVAVACSEAVATDIQSTRVEHIPEGEGEEVETQGSGVVIFVVIDFAVLEVGVRFVVLEEVFCGFRF